MVKSFDANERFGPPGAGVITRPFAERTFLHRFAGNDFALVCLKLPGNQIEECTLPYSVLSDHSNTVLLFEHIGEIGNHGRPIVGF